VKAGVPEGRLRADGSENLPTKLVKYIPGETLAFFVPAASLLGTSRDGLLLAATAVGAVGTVGWLWYTSRSEPPEKRPLPHFYVLAVIAFVLWCIVTAPNLADVLHIDDVVAGLLLMVGVFLIPLADGILEKIVPRRRTVQQG
jgi:hypothetical protein